MKLMTHYRRLLVVPLVLTATLLTGCMGANYYYKKGQQEYARQDYHQAFADTLAAAKYGNTDAQYAVGYMYFYGVGTEQSDYLASLWFNRAASVGDPRAIAALERIHNRAENPLLFGMDRAQRGSKPTPPHQPDLSPAPPKQRAPRTTYTTTPKYQPSGQYSAVSLPPLPAPHSTQAFKTPPNNKKA